MRSHAFGWSGLTALLAIVSSFGATDSIVAQAAPAASSAVAIRAPLILPVGAPPIRDGLLVVEGGKVLALGPAARVAVPEGATLRTLETGVITPGFVDAGCFIGARRARRDEGPVEGDGVTLANGLQRDREAVRAALAAGITTLHVVTDRQPVIGGLSTVVAPRADGSVEVLSEEAGLVASLDERAWNPNEPPTSLVGGLRLMTAAREDPRFAGVASRPGGLMVHVRTPRELEAMARFGRAHAPVIALVHGGLRERAEVAGALEGLRGCVLLPASDRPALRHGDAVLAHRAGLRFAFASAQPLLPAQGLRWQAVLARLGGVPADRALAALTLDAAELLGIGDRAGSILVGRRADLLIWDRHPTEPTARLLEVHLAGERVAGATREDG